MSVANHSDEPSPLTWTPISAAAASRSSTGSGAGLTDPAIPHAALASVARALQNILERYSGSAMRRVVGVADEYGIDGLYVAVIVMRERTAWPSMRSEDRHALELASRLMTGFAMLPSTTYMQVPPAEVDALIDRVLTSVAQWARQRLTSDLKHEYMALLEEYAERLRPVLEAQRPGAVDDPLADRPAITIALMEAFERWLAKESTLPARRPMLAILEGLFG
jgi:hypothetical protein